MMGDLNEWCKHDTLAAYCGDCMIELHAELSAVKHQRDELVEALEYYADQNNYVPVASTTIKTGMVHGTIHDFDRGVTAKAALAKVKTIDQQDWTLQTR